MDFNTLLLRLGIDPSRFKNEEREPIRTEEDTPILLPKQTTTISEPSLRQLTDTSILKDSANAH